MRKRRRGGIAKTLGFRQQRCHGGTRRATSSEHLAFPTTSPRRNALPVAAMRVWGKYAPVDLVRRLYREKSEPVLGSELMEISIMSSDIKGFTTLSEQLRPNRLADMLGLYLEALSRIIQQETHGTIDKYIGDAIMTIGTRPSRWPMTPKWRASPRYAAAKRRDLSRNTGMARISCLRDTLRIASREGSGWAFRRARPDELHRNRRCDQTRLTARRTQQAIR